ncbi:hypothetical protein [Actinoplanes flavus]|uniref:Uncharacterized protein n=1 Tax=Actinoplanes flavus TaxID=2820290 RepID=A0ABS3UMY6_9ACTN|nr:hypothetical protein [Actinoplanes flavus]MBO3740154.1 hypothetical protein [Actinoplanes flavus]
MSVRRMAVAAVVVLLTVTGCPGPDQPPEKQRVALVVVDEFEVAGEPTEPAEGDGNCAYRGIGTGEVGGKGAPHPGIPAGSVHGELVLEEIRQEMRAGGRWGTNGTAQDKAAYGVDVPDVRTLESWSSGADKEIVLTAVHVAGYQTQRITGLLKSVTDGMKQTQGITAFVINMSFVLGPCKVEPFAAVQHTDPEQLLQMYRNVVAVEPTVQDLKNFLDTLVGKTPEAIAVALLDQRLQRVRDAFAGLPDQLKMWIFYQPQDIDDGTIDPEVRNTVVDNDPLYLFLADLVGGSGGLRVVPVAAAGNGIGVATEGTPPSGFRLDFPFAPAIWKNVVSVSALSRRTVTSDRACGTDPLSAERAWYSNSGEIRYDGDFDHTPKGGPCQRLTGTSFAAPRISYREALFLLAGGTVDCGTGIRPPLGYVEDDTGKGNVWQNLTIPEITPNHCPDFEKVTEPIR